MTDNKDNKPIPPTPDGPPSDAPPPPSKDEQERLQKRIEELRKRDPFIYR